MLLVSYCKPLASPSLSRVLSSAGRSDWSAVGPFDLVQILVLCGICVIAFHSLMPIVGPSVLAGLDFSDAVEVGIVPIRRNRPRD